MKVCFLLTCVLGVVLQRAYGAQYRVTVKTGGCILCGTNDDIFVRIVGKNGKTDKHELASSKDDFDKGDEDTYSFSDPKFVGDFIAVEIKKTHSFVSNDWNLQWRVRPNHSNDPWIRPRNRMRISYGSGQGFYFTYYKYVPNERWFTVFVTCPDGYVKNHQGYCEDVNECSDGKSCVGPHSNCDNSIGSFSCSCDKGYKLSNGRCINVNECDTKPCDQICVDHDGWYECKCNTGYKLVSQRKCENINECQTNNPCSPANTCVDEVGSYRCQCPRGYYNSDRNTCSDIDECTGSSPCDLGTSRCVNTPGDYRCDCRSGFESESQYKCRDKNECAGSNSCDSSKSTCVNHVGGYSCRCKTGFHTGANNKICEPDQCGPLGDVTGGSYEPKDRCSVDKASKYGDSCTLVCENGYDISSSVHKDLKCGQYGRWTGTRASCVPKSCPPLTKPVNGGLLQSSCAKDGGKYPGHCSYYCNNGYTLVGDSKRSCQADGTWGGATPKCNKEFAKPWIQCPANIIMTLAPGQKTAKVGNEWKNPKHNAQSLTVHPSSVSSNYPFPAGRSTVRWTATNPAGSASCEMYVNVYDREAPKNEFCPSKVFATSTESSGPITWSEPRFSDNVGITKVMKSHTSGQTFLLGTYNVYYTAEDAAGNRAQCRFEVQLTRKGCGPLKGPVNGQHLCQAIASSQFCSVTCPKGTLVYKSPSRYGYWSCAGSKWDPTDEIPDCVAVSSNDGNTPCPEGSVKMSVLDFTGKATNYCAQCPTGARFSADQCVACSAGSYNDVQGSLTCKPCLAGSGSFAGAKSSNECLPLCATGSYSNTGFGPTCSLCPLDTFSDKAGSKNCTSCPLGTSTKHVGASTAIACGRKPSITRIVPASASITDGENVEFSCYVSGAPHPVMSWKFLRTDIPDAYLGKMSRSLIKDQSGKTIGMKLVITGAKVYNTGTYECTAQNTHGSAKALATLNVDQASGSGGGANF